MPDLEFSPIEQDEDLFGLVNELKDGLVAVATGGSMAEEDYARIRRRLRRSSVVAEELPEFVARCRSVDEFWGFIKRKFAKYQERRDYLAQEFNELLDRLEGLEVDLGERFERIGVLGHGGYGVVERHRHRHLKEDFAIKYYSPHPFNDNPDNLERFFREARILFRLNHPNIVRVFDVGLRGKRPFIVTEYFDGQPLSKLLSGGSYIPPSRAMALVVAIAEALRHAHEDVRVIHRDVSPRNILAKKPGEFRLIDFGIGVFIEDELSTRLTREGARLAGGPYTAPELRSNPMLKDPRSDIWSVGAVWYEMVCKETPVAGNDPRPRLLSTPGVKQDQAEIIAKCLAPLDERYPTAHALIDAIGTIENGRSVRAGAPVAPPKQLIALDDAEATALKFVMAAGPEPGGVAYSNQVVDALERVGVTRWQAGIALRTLQEHGLLASKSDSDWNGEKYIVLDATDAGVAWLRSCPTRLAKLPEFEREPRGQQRVSEEYSDSDIPF